MVTGQHRRYRASAFEELLPKASLIRRHDRERYRIPSSHSRYAASTAFVPVCIVSILVSAQLYRTRP